MEGTNDLPGGALASDFLNINTAEDAHRLDGRTTSGNDAAYAESEGLAGAPDGTALNILTGIGVRHGTLAGNGPYLPGDSCLFQGLATG